MIIDTSAILALLFDEAAWIGVRRSPVLKERFERIMNNDPDRKKIAIVAMAHHLCRVNGCDAAQRPGVASKTLGRPAAGG